MEEQDKLNIGIGEKEPEVLKPANVKVVNVKITPVEIKGKENEKVNVEVKHPQREETIQISKAKILKNDKLTTSGLWYAIDSDKKIAKKSALAVFLNSAGVSTLNELKERELQTIADENGYLVFKAY